jgi:peroxidase
MTTTTGCRAFAVAVACCLLLAVPSLVAQAPSSLSLEHYSKACPNVEHVVRTEMECAVREDTRNAALMLRLHFHDCFVQGCDGSVLLDDTATTVGEKQADQNVNSLKGFELVDKIKEKLEAECPGAVSCADLLAIAARDAVVLVSQKRPFCSSVQCAVVCIISSAASCIFA